MSVKRNQSKQAFTEHLHARHENRKQRDRVKIKKNQNLSNTHQNKVKPVYTTNNIFVLGMCSLARYVSNTRRGEYQLRRTNDCFAILRITNCTRAKTPTNQRSNRKRNTVFTSHRLKIKKFPGEKLFESAREKVPIHRQTMQMFFNETTTDVDVDFGVSGEKWSQAALLSEPTLSASEQLSTNTEQKGLRQWHPPLFADV